MDAWEGWDFQRSYLLFVCAAFLLLGTQVFLFHRPTREPPPTGTRGT